MIDKTIDKSLRWVDDRLGVAKGGRVFLDKIFPDHWSFMLGEIALYSFIILLATGVFLIVAPIFLVEPPPLRYSLMGLGAFFMLVDLIVIAALRRPTST